MELKQMIRQAWSKRIYNNSDNAKVQKKAQPTGWADQINLAKFADSPTTNWAQMRLSIPSKEDKSIMAEPWD